VICGVMVTAALMGATALLAQAAGVTLAELDGAVVETANIYDRTDRLCDQVISSPLTTDRRITIGSGEALCGRIETKEWATMDWLSLKTCRRSYDGSELNQKPVAL
jgi:hypothetical protein